jgi:hypothetical protein
VGSALAQRASLDRPQAWLTVARTVGADRQCSVAAETVEELLGCSLRTEDVQGHVRPVLRHDRPSLFRFGTVVTHDDAYQAPFIAQATPHRILATFRHLADGLPQPTDERASGARPPRRVEKKDGIRTLQPKVERLEVVAVRDPSVTGEHATLRLSPLVLRGFHPSRFPEVNVEMDHRQAGSRRQFPGERALPRPSEPDHENASADASRKTSHRVTLPKAPLARQYSSDGMASRGMRWTLGALALGAMLAGVVLWMGACVGARPRNVDCFGDQACMEAAAPSFPIGFAVAAAGIVVTSIVIAIVRNRRA